MARELELKAVVEDPGELRRRLQEAGAEPSFTGLMRDRRYDRGGELSARDEVLRVRTFESSGQPSRVVLGWKGRTGTSPLGYKEREEFECQCTGAFPGDILARLGFEQVHVIERWVEQFALTDTMIRLETYPGMDMLVEIEGSPAAIEAAIAVSGIPRDHFTPEPLAKFIERYEQRTGTHAVLNTDDLPGQGLPWHE